MKAETIRRKFRQQGIKFIALPDESPRQYAPSEIQHRKDPMYPVGLSVRHKYFDPKIRYQRVDMPKAISSRLTSYALRLIGEAV